MNNLSKSAKLADPAQVIETRRNFENLSPSEQKREQLSRLRTFVRQLAETPQGRLDFDERRRLLGSCDPGPNDDAATYYRRLRRWIDEDPTARRKLFDQR